MLEALSAKDPGAHIEQKEAPFSEEYLPGEQEKHCVDSGVFPLI